MGFLLSQVKAALGGIILALCFSVTGAGQGNGASKAPATPPAVKKPSSVKQIDFAGLRKALTPSAKPLLVNFWATWCDPCREEFPELVKLDAEYKGKIDFITISLDELSEINGDVPKFLAEMKAEMPAYLLKAVDDDAAIAFVSKEWSGALPLTILYDPSGKQAYYRQGKVRIETVRAEIDKLISPESAPRP
jgi:thiol-disulfide isomerase/thioredoxin